MPLKPRETSWNAYKRPWNVPETSCNDPRIPQTQTPQNPIEHLKLSGTPWNIPRRLWNTPVTSLNPPETPRNARETPWNHVKISVMLLKPSGMPLGPLERPWKTPFLWPQIWRSVIRSELEKLLNALCELGSSKFSVSLVNEINRFVLLKFWSRLPCKPLWRPSLVSTNLVGCIIRFSKTVLKLENYSRMSNARRPHQN